MKTTAIICEYNPFHNGHAYHIQKTKEETGAQYIIALMSGNFVQRGAPAIMEKQLRTQMALNCGADLVIELPLWSACASAPYFAAGSIALLNGLGIVDSLSFGSECDDIQQLKDVAAFLYKHRQELSDQAARYASAGHSYSKAKALAFKDLAPDSNWLPILETPNNLLALEYLISLQETKSKIRPYCIARKESSHHETSLPSDSQLASASAIRNTIESFSELKEIFPMVPKPVFSILEQHFERDFPVTCDDFSLLLKQKLILDPSLTDYWDISHDFQFSIQKNLTFCSSFTELLAKCKSKNITWSRISRNLMHILLEMRKEQQEIFKAFDYRPYFQILGFRKDASELIREIQKHSVIPMVRHCRSLKDPLSPCQEQLLAAERRANLLYHLILGEKFHIDWKDRQIIV